MSSAEIQVENELLLEVKQLQEFVPRYTARVLDTTLTDLI